MLYTGWHWQVLYCADSGGVGTYLTATNDVPQVVNLLRAEFTLTQFHIQYVLTEVVKDTLELTLVLVIASTINKNIIEVH